MLWMRGAEIKAPILCVKTGAPLTGASFRSVSASFLKCSWTPEAGLATGRQEPLVLSRRPLKCV